MKKHTNRPAFIDAKTVIGQPNFAGETQVSSVPRVLARSYEQTLARSSAEMEIPLPEIEGEEPSLQIPGYPDLLELAIQKFGSR